jgi:hypothetical protein
MTPLEKIAAIITILGALITAVLWCANIDKKIALLELEHVYLIKSNEVSCHPSLKVQKTN